MEGNQKPAQSTRSIVYLLRPRKSRGKCRKIVLWVCCVCVFVASLLVFARESFGPAPRIHRGGEERGVWATSSCLDPGGALGNGRDRGRQEKHGGSSPGVRSDKRRPGLLVIPYKGALVLLCGSPECANWWLVVRVNGPWLVGGWDGPSYPGEQFAIIVTYTQTPEA